MNFLGCVWYYVATIEGLDRSWLTSVGMCTHHCMPRYYTLPLSLKLEPCLSWQGACGKFRRSASITAPSMSVTVHSVDHKSNDCLTCMPCTAPWELGRPARGVCLQRSGSHACLDEINWRTSPTNCGLSGGGKQDLSQADGPRQWVAAIYFITMTITTVGGCASCIQCKGCGACMPLALPVGLLLMQDTTQEGMHLPLAVPWKV